MVRKGKLKKAGSEVYHTDFFWGGSVRLSWWHVALFLETSERDREKKKHGLKGTSDNIMTQSPTPLISGGWGGG